MPVTSFAEKFAIERVVTVLTPVFGALAALVTRLITTALPSAHVSSGDLTALEIAAFSWASAGALHWVHGRQVGWLKTIPRISDTTHSFSDPFAEPPQTAVPIPVGVVVPPSASDPAPAGDYFARVPA